MRPHLEREARLAVVASAPEFPVEADLHLYHLAGRVEHGFVFRALLASPGLVLLEDWDLHRLVHAETSGRGDRRGWRTAARRAGGDAGAFVAELLERGVAGEMLPLLLPLLEPALDAATAVAAFNEDTRARVAVLRPGLPLARVPLPLVVAAPGADREAARRGLGLESERALVAVLAPEGALARERVAAAIAPLREEPRLHVRDVPGTEDAGRDALVAAADVLVALDHPSRGRLDPLVAAALHAGVAVLVTAGSTAALELPEGVVARVGPGETEAAELRALVLRLALDVPLRRRVGALARAHASVAGDAARAAALLLALARVAIARPAARRPGKAAGPLAATALDEAAWTARSAGLDGAPADVAALVSSLFAGR